MVVELYDVPARLVANGGTDGETWPCGPMGCPIQALRAFRVVLQGAGGEGGGGFFFIFSRKVSDLAPAVREKAFRANSTEKILRTKIPLGDSRH